MGDELRYQSRIFDLLIVLSWMVSIDGELHSLKRLELKFGLSFQNFSTTYL